MPVQVPYSIGVRVVFFLSIDYSPSLKSSQSLPVKTTHIVQPVINRERQQLGYSKACDIFLSRSDYDAGQNYSLPHIHVVDAGLSD
jgi:hypothetical protein